MLSSGPIAGKVKEKIMIAKTMITRTQEITKLHIIKKLPIMDQKVFTQIINRTVIEDNSSI